MSEHKEYPENQAIKIWTKNGGGTYSIVDADMGYGPNHYCGYARIRRRELIEEGYDGIARYVPVHGGITYAREAEDGSMVYGFDCAHSGDATNPDCRDMDWLKAQCENMAYALALATEYEKGYLLAKSNEEKAKIIDAYHEQLSKSNIEFNLHDNFGAMISVLAGKL